MSSSTFLSCDWGTTHLRIRLVETGTLKVLRELKTAEGAAELNQQRFGDRRQRFEHVLLQRSQEIFQQTGISARACVISGMASSGIGWQELPYALAPLSLSAEKLVATDFTLGSLKVLLVSGVCTDTDVMRGEECETLGLLHLLPELRLGKACLILPGTHSKHIHLDGSKLSNFTTHMTGEAYAQLQKSPTLQAALASDDELSEEEFRAGVRAAKQTGLLAAMFQIRARMLTGHHDDLHGPSYLSGVLIGSELLHLPPAERHFLASNALLRERYSLAADTLHLSLQLVPSDILSQALIRAHSDLLSRLP